MSINPVNPPINKDKDTTSTTTTTTTTNSSYVRPTYSRGRPQPQQDLHRINDRIREPEVRLVGDNIEPGVYPIKKALEIAQALGLDLVEISDKATPPICRAVDYSKFKYEQKKKQKEIKSNSQKSVVKEIRFGPNTDEHDFDFKVKHAHNFLKEGNKVRAYVQFVGRTIVFKERGEVLLLKFAQALEEVCKVEQMPKLEGKRMSLQLSPRVVPLKK
jgi:translation initiation factor IF-3